MKRKAQIIRKGVYQVLVLVGVIVLNKETGTDKVIADLFSFGKVPPVLEVQ